MLLIFAGEMLRSAPLFFCFPDMALPFLSCFSYRTRGGRHHHVLSMLGFCTCGSAASVFNALSIIASRFVFVFDKNGLRR